MKERLYRFMQGRYGNDQLNRFLMVIMLMCLVISFFAGNAFYAIGLILLVYMYFRMFSRNTYGRSAENQAFLRFRNKITAFFRGKKSMSFNDKTHHIYLCPTCKQKIRVPKGKGKIAIRCPKCSKEFIKRS